MLNDVLSSRAKEIIKTQQQPQFPLKYDHIYGPYAAITSIEKSYKKDFINLLLTSPGEWPMSPQIGVGLKHYLFEFKNSEKLISLGATIQNQLKRHLPAVELVDIKYDFGKEEELEYKNSVRIILIYTILGTSGYVTSFDTSQDTAEVVVEELQETKLQSSDLFDRRSALLSSVVNL
tara:strand:- start:1388 stop:1918 length:531 start_codon:yes stop_codon:yes gene_type:complete